MPADWDIEVGQTVRRREGIHGGKGLPERFGGAWYGGIEPSASTPNVFVFTEPEKASQTGYTFDGWGPDGVFYYTGEGLHGDQRMVDGNRAIRDHGLEGRSLRVFRSRPPHATYLGEFEVCDDPPFLRADAPEAGNGAVRTVIVFRLRPVGPFARLDLPETTVRVTSEVADIPPQTPPTTVIDMAPEANAAGAYAVEPSSEPVEHLRREAALVDRYKRHLTQQGSAFSRKRILIPDDAGRLYTDLHDHSRGELVEAKGSSSRESVRTGLGQLLDYGRFVPHAALALLIPVEPRPDLVDLLHAHGCGVIWESEPGHFTRRDP